MEEAAAGHRSASVRSRLGIDAEHAREREIEKLHAKIGQLTVENSFLTRKPGDRGEPGGAGLAAVEHDGCRVLCRRPRRGAGALRKAGDLQYRSGFAVYQRRLHRPVGKRGVRISMT